MISQQLPSQLYCMKMCQFGVVSSEFNKKSSQRPGSDKCTLRAGV